MFNRMREQQFRHIFVAGGGRFVQRCLTVFRYSIDTCIVGEQQPRHVAVTLYGHPVQGRMAVFVLAINFSPVGEEKFHYVLIALFLAAAPAFGQARPARARDLARFIHEFRGPTASEPDFMQCLAQFQVLHKNDSVSNGLPATVAADPHFRWLG
jgi:hypothetical protein